MSFISSLPQDPLPSLKHIAIANHARYFPDLSIPYFSPSLQKTQPGQPPVWQQLKSTKIYVAVGECERFYSECAQLVERMKQDGLEVTLRVVSSVEFQPLPSLPCKSPILNKIPAQSQLPGGTHLDVAIPETPLAWLNNNWKLVERDIMDIVLSLEKPH